MLPAGRAWWSAFLDRYQTPGPDVLSEDDLPGMSGGPAFLIRQQTVIAPALCGLVKQGLALSDGNRILYFARLERIRPDGTIDG